MKTSTKRTNEVIRHTDAVKKIAKESRKKNVHQNFTCVIPKDIIFFKILPWLPFKFLCQLKCISKEWCSVISNERQFTFHQSCSISAIPGSYIYHGMDTLNFHSTSGNPVGVPEPSFWKTIGNSNRHSIISIVASTNGLICLICGNLTDHYSCRDTFLYVCNPATAEGEFIPFNSNTAEISLSTLDLACGLAFNPSSTPASYKLVQLELKKHTPNLSAPDVHAYFVVFVYSSETGQWVESKAKTNILLPRVFESLNCIVIRRKSIFVGGVLFWELSGNLLCYDIEKDYIEQTHYFPKPDASYHFQDIGQCGGRVTLTRISGLILDFWMLLGTSWELMHRVDLKYLMDPFNYFKVNITPSGYLLRPLPCNNDEEKIYLHVNGIEQSAELLCYDIKRAELLSSGRLCLSNRDVWWQHRIFSYHNSLVALPRRLGL